MAENKVRIDPEAILAGVQQEQEYYSPLAGNPFLMMGNPNLFDMASMRYPITAEGAANYAKGLVSGTAGIPGDMAGMMNAAAQVSRGTPLPIADYTTPIGTDAIGRAMGADVESPGFVVGSFGIPGAEDLVKLGAISKVAAMVGKVTKSEGKAETIGDVLNAGRRVDAPQQPQKYYRFTDGDTPFNDIDYAMFSNDRDAVSRYGDNEWVTVSDDKSVNAADIVGDFEDALENYPEVLDTYQATAKQLAEEINPDDIVNSAQVFDAPDLVEILYRDVLEPNGYDSVVTSDGLISFNPNKITTPAPEQPQTVGGLPDDYESRMKRARDMGFDIDAYHGTRADIDEFDQYQVDIGVHVGTVDAANVRLSDTEALRKGKSRYATRNKDFGDEANIMPLKVKAKKPLRMDDVGEWRDPYEVAKGITESDFLARNPKYRRAVEDIQQQADEWRDMGDYDDYLQDEDVKGLVDELNEILRSGGHDSIIYNNFIESRGGGADSLIILDTRNIRSRHANFDPSKKDSANLMASHPAATIGALLAAGTAVSQQE